MTSQIQNINDPRYVRALGHPLRVRILAILEERTASAVEMSRMLRAPLGVVAYHVRTLDRLGLIELVRETPVRGAIQRFFRARERPTVSAQASNAFGGFDRAEAHITRTAIKLDGAGFDRLAGALGEVLREVDEIEREVASRREAAGEDAPPLEDAGLVMMLFEAQPLSAGAVRDPEGA